MNMTQRRICIVIVLIVAAVSGGAYLYFYRNHSNFKKELGLINNAFAHREDFRAGSRAYMEIVVELDALRYVALYNLANMYLREGVRAGDGAILNLAVQYYKEALRRHPDFWEARKNLEIAERLREPFLKKILEKQLDDSGKVPGKKLPDLVPYVPSLP